MESGMERHPLPRRGRIKAQIFRCLFSSLVALLVLACQGMSSEAVDPSVQEAIALLNSGSTETVSDPLGNDSQMIGWGTSSLPEQKKDPPST